MQIVYYLIDGLQSDRRAVALTEIGVIITAHARKARNFWLDRLPVFGGSPASGNEDNGGKARRLAIAIYGDAPLPNADHTLFRKGRQRCRQTQENGHNSRCVEAHFKHLTPLFEDCSRPSADSAHSSADMSLAFLTALLPGLQHSASAEWIDGTKRRPRGDLCPFPNRPEWLPFRRALTQDRPPGWSGSLLNTALGIRIFRLPEGRFGIAIGDVSGKGIGAALMMASLEASLRGRLRWAMT